MFAEVLKSLQKHCEPCVKKRYLNRRIVVNAGFSGQLRQTLRFFARAGCGCILAPCVLAGPHAIGWAKPVDPPSSHIASRLNMPKYVVRTGSTRALGIMSPHRDEAYQRGNQVVIRTERGLEAGEVLCEATDAALADMKDSPGGQILRKMTGDDQVELSRLCAQERQEFETCKRLITQQDLPMKLVDVEHLFGGERVIVYYLSETRVDFRELVRLLAAEFQTRIEMRQIGVRDEAKLLADYGDCGKPVCCNTHLSEMPPVSMKMAKIQKATLDPTKISGRCGRLKCCLRYEYDTYEALQKELPPLGSDIVTSRGRARVLAQEILAGQLLVETEDRRRILIEASDVLTVLKRGGGRTSHGESPEDVSPDDPTRSGMSSADPSTAAE
jgi:cell fate regulator YaaT (PSP1 superfamily)